MESTSRLEIFMLIIEVLNCLAAWVAIVISIRR